MEDEMTITKTNEDKLVLNIEGRVDTTTSPALQAELIPAIKDNLHVILDFSKVAYISSAGLRSLLTGQKEAKAVGGSMVLRHVNDEVQEVFDMTGFASMLTIEP
jgi:anti-anti-sigma factor